MKRLTKKRERENGQNIAKFDIKLKDRPKNEKNNNNK